jgi:hypothetical protein
MPHPQASEQALIDQFLEVLRSLPDVQAEVDSGGAPAFDTQVTLDIAGNRVHAILELKKGVYPRDVRQVVWRISHLATQRSVGESGAEALPVLIAESISPGAKELLRAERIGYYDSGGSLYLPARGAYLYVDRPPLKASSRSMRTLFAGRRAQVLHALLVRSQDWFGVKDLAEQARVSPGTASQVLTEMERFDWLTSRGQGPNKQRYLREPAALLDAWAQQVTSIRPPALRRYFVPAMKPDGLMEHLAQVCEAHHVEYAISFEAAAQRYAPFLSAVSQVRCRVLAGTGGDAVVADLDARVVSEGANLVVIEARSAGELLFRERVGGVLLASPVQVYLDLLRGEGRAKEMAEHLRQERIGF